MLIPTLLFLCKIVSSAVELLGYNTLNWYSVDRVRNAKNESYHQLPNHHESIPAGKRFSFNDYLPGLFISGKVAAHSDR